ncbi:MAG: hypothetical protein AAFQ07_14225 [Chloroflexota bacterium]
MTALNLKRHELKQRTRGGFAFPLAYGMTMAIVAGMAFTLSPAVASMALLFQGVVALPVAFGIARLTSTNSPQDHPLNDLSAFLAGSQALALPAYILVYSIDPLYLPMIFACVGGMHFVPYVWLQSSKAWLVLATGMTFIPFWMVVMFGVTATYAFIPLVLSLLLLATGGYVYLTSQTRV